MSDPPPTTTTFAQTAAAWPLVDKFFRSPNARYRLTQHHLQSYSDFVRYKIPTVLHDFNGWKHSAVFEGNRFRADATEDHDARMNDRARAHFFVGMDPHDVYEMSRSVTDPQAQAHRPRRFQVRHQQVRDIWGARGGRAGSIGSGLALSAIAFGRRNGE